MYGQRVKKIGLKKHFYGESLFTASSREIEMPISQKPYEVENNSKHYLHHFT